MDSLFNSLVSVSPPSSPSSCMVLYPENVPHSLMKATHLSPLAPALISNQSMQLRARGLCAMRVTWVGTLVPLLVLESCGHSLNLGASLNADLLQRSPVLSPQLLGCSCGPLSGHHLLHQECLETNRSAEAQSELLLPGL